MAAPLTDDVVLVADPEPVAHARRRYSASSSVHRLQSHHANEPVPAPTDPDTCRICRGEATDEEPLFFPCKCSGSIKYVHQDCLLEWLSHSQKKHCELCKTNFRFTKLYDHSMPKTIPFFVFVTHIAKYMFDNMLVWMRAALVFSMWLIWLPYLMRSIWSLMFWISDEGFGGGGSSIFGGRDSSLWDPNGMDAGASAHGQTMCPSSPLFAATSTVATIGGVLDQMPLSRLAASFGTNTTPGGDPMYAGFLQLLFSAIGLGGNRTTTNQTMTTTSSSASSSLSASTTSALGNNPVNGTGLSGTALLIGKQLATARHHHRSLFSDVAWLKNLTRRPMLNRNVIYVLEGQVITVLVIICFILIILVRDYVVLQQPEINMRAAFAAAENMGGAENNAHQPERVPELENPAAGLRAEDIEGLRGPDPAGYDEEEVASLDSARAQEGSNQEEHGSGLRDYDGDFNEVRSPGINLVRQRPYKDPTNRYAHIDIGNGNGNGNGSGEASATAPTHPGRGDLRRHGHVSRLDQISRQASINPPLDGLEASTVNEYLKIFREAGGDQDLILRLVRERRLEERLGYWVRLTESMRDRVRTIEQTAAERQPDTGSGSPFDFSFTPFPSTERDTSTIERPEAEEQSESGEDGKMATERRGSDISSDWTFSHRSQYAGSTGSPTSSSKGKEKAVDADDAPGEQRQQQPISNRNRYLPSPPPIDKGKGKAFDDATSSPSNRLPRQRAHSDGPFRPSGVHPLANNNWAISKNEEMGARPQSSMPLREPYATLHANDKISIIPQMQPETQPGAQPEPGRLGAARTEHHQEQGGQGEQGEDQHGTEWDNLPDFNELLPEDAAVPDGQAEPQQAPIGLVGRLADFMWRDVQVGNAAAEIELPEDFDGEAAADEVEEVMNGDARREVVDVEGGHAQDGGGLLDAANGALEAPALEREREADAAPGADADADAAEGLDPEAIEDAEDFEGVMELLGMRGPIAGLFQNAIFCAFLVSVTVFAGIFLPYNIGRIGVWIMAHPMRPLRILFSLVKFVQDVALVVIGFVSWAVLRAASMVGSVVLDIDHVSRGYIMPAVATSYNMSADAALRIVDSFTVEPPIISTSEIRNFSAISHDALLTLKANISYAFASIGRALMFVFGGNYTEKSVETVSFVSNATTAAWDGLKEVPGVLTDPSSWVINLNPTETAAEINPELAYWDGTDRFWAVAGGYLALCLLAALYLHRGRPFSSSQAGQDREASIIDGLNQASGVMKVILIIGIEMLIFPLYCGLLLDVALLPLFENTTLRSRVLFTYNYPLTSIFVHWFVGTGYMFHFALFVSMCRKIMRKGVLYFIRDPDDPEFHPVRDVLERNVTTQLRKILFSAFVYGALVIICLGGVVWGLWLSLPSVLPIHYSSNEPVLEFPIDLLFYNFLMPLAVKFFKPSDGLHAMYTWWFRKCARGLRITWFLFGERRIDEEGVLVLAPESEYRKLPLWRRLFLEVNLDGEVVPRTWSDMFDGGEAKPMPEITIDAMSRLRNRKSELLKSEQLIPDGRFVRTPASDQVKIPKGKRVFLEVSELGERLDSIFDNQADSSDSSDSSFYSAKTFQQVYIPPHFRLRIFLFILFIWIFAAVTGVGFTIIPLVFGRRIFKMLIPAHIRTNDIYAFSIGIYILGSLAYSLFHLRELYGTARTAVANFAAAASDHAAAKKAAAMLVQGTRLAYSYFFLLVVFPLLVASLMELYFLIPLDTYMYSAIFARTGLTGGDAAAQIEDGGTRHTVRVIQAWTIGLLYLKLASRIITVWYSDTRMSAAVEAVLNRGWLNPNVGVLTRAFVIPGLAASAVAIAGPLGAARLFLAYHGADAGGPLQPTIIYRLSFPLAAFAAVLASMAWATLGIFRSWRVRIRDEAYLIGERLHNFGAGAGPAGARVAWREGHGVARM